MLERTRFAFESVSNHFASTGRDALIESFCVQYLVVCLYSEMERMLSNIVSDRLSQIEDQKVAKFIASTNDAMIRRVKKAEINDLLKKFGCDQLVEAEIDELNLQPYFDAIANRHLVTHSEGCSMTLDEFSRAIPCAEKILEKVTGAIG